MIQIVILPPSKSVKPSGNHLNQTDFILFFTSCGTLFVAQMSRSSIFLIRRDFIHFDFDGVDFIFDGI